MHHHGGGFATGVTSSRLTLGLLLHQRGDLTSLDFLSYAVVARESLLRSIKLKHSKLKEILTVKDPTVLEGIF